MKTTIEKIKLFGHYSNGCGLTDYYIIYYVSGTVRHFHDPNKLPKTARDFIRKAYKNPEYYENVNYRNNKYLIRFYNY